MRGRDRERLDGQTGGQADREADRQTQRYKIKIRTILM